MNKLSKCCSHLVFYDQFKTLRCNSCLLPTKPIRRARNGLIMLFTVILVLGFSTKENSSVNIPIYKETPKDSCDLELCDSVLLKEMLKDSILCPEIVILQAHLESDFYKSIVCKTNHNFLGIKYIGRSPYQIKELNGHAYYDSYRSCLLDYKLTQNYYLDNLQRKYAISPNYKKTLIEIK